jgi:DNA-binding NarL/FixJ family response regulator
MKVLIVDDHPAVREGLAARIAREPDLEICGEATDVDDALACVASSEPDVVVVDLTLKTGNGLDLVKQLKARNSRAQTLVWSTFDVSLYGIRSIRAGASGYINKEAPTARVIDAIRRIHRGEIYLPAAENETTVSDGSSGDSLDDLHIDQLSDRELEVFRYLGQGYDVAEIAERMQLSAKTIETFRDRIKKKLKITGRAKLLKTAVEWVIDHP